MHFLRGKAHKKSWCEKAKVFYSSDQELNTGPPFSLQKGNIRSTVLIQSGPYNFSFDRIIRFGTVPYRNSTVWRLYLKMKIWRTSTSLNRTAVTFSGMHKDPFVWWGFVLDYNHRRYRVSEGVRIHIRC